MRPRALVAPDSFKGTFDAPTVARALGEGLAQAGWKADLCPVADGGEGTMALLVEAKGPHCVFSRHRAGHVTRLGVPESMVADSGESLV